MKKNLFIAVSLLSFLWAGNYSFAQTYSSVVVTPVTADYSATPPTVTFEVSWPAGSRDATHRSKVWLLVDYKRIQNNAYTGDWLRAGIMTGASSPTATAGSTVSLETGNTKGFWLQGPSDGFAFAATVTVPVTVDLTGYASQFGWCGVASDRPPTAVEQDGYYALYGTQPFIIQTHPTNTGQTVTEPSKAYIGCIYNLTDSTGCPGEVPAMPAITDFTASKTAICEGESVTLTATATGAASYSFNNGAWSSSSTTVESPTSATTYTLSVRSAGGCTVPATKAITVTVNDPPVPQSLTTVPDVICAGESATLTAAAVGAASYSLNGSTWTASEQLTDYPTETTTYTLYIKSAAGCTASLPDAATVTVNDLPSGLSLTSATICNGESTTLTATPAGAASYRLDSEAWQSAATFEISPTATKTYALYVQSAEGCTASLPDAATVTVHPAFSPGAITTATGTAIEGTDPNITIGSATNASGGYGSITYQWRRSGDSGATFSYDAPTYPLNNNSTNYSTEGTYYFTRYAHDGFCNTAWAASTGQYTLTVASSEPPYSSGMWTCGTQTWSGPLRNPAGCTNAASLSTETSPPAQYYDRVSSYGYYYNWACFNSYGGELCPSPWHVPDRSDFSTLVICVAAGVQYPSTVLVGVLGNTGYVEVDSHEDAAHGYWWTIDEQGNKAYTLHHYSYTTIYDTMKKTHGIQVRCVQ